VVVARAVDPAAKPREIADDDPTTVQALKSLFEDDHGAIWAELGERLPVERLPRHAATYRVRPSLAGFPLRTQRSASSATKASNAAYIAQLPAMRAWLIEVAKRGGTVTYAEARKPFGMKTFEHRHAMDRVGHECVDAGEPILTSLIVDPDTGRCSDGFHKEFGRDDALERADCYAFWQEGAGAARIDAGALREAARKFAQVELRPQQRAFRSRVFLAAGGACHVTGCRIVAALDAAHRRGRRWQDGHNTAQDGWLLRKDIHAMYDAGLLHIDDNGAVAFDPSVREHYLAYAKD
jgi:hypothetical protein